MIWADVDYDELLLVLEERAAMNGVHAPSFEELNEWDRTLIAQERARSKS